MERYEKFAKDIALQAGEIIRSNFKMGISKQWKSDNSPVTEIDIRVNQLILDSVRKEFPGHSVLAEEGSELLDGSRYVWVCDPIDGTLPFTHGVPLFTFSLALVDDGKPVLGLVYEPVMDRMFFAKLGGGAFLNDKKISVSDVVDFSRGVMAVEGGETPMGINNFDIMKTLKKEGAHLLKFSSFVITGALVSAGEFLSTIFLNNTVHDVAAIKIIVEEAGGKATDLQGNNQRYDGKINGFIASNGLVHDRLVEIVNRK
jgi:fructose-1,6-bisphosphatase/inositol monophosphatase family enzyme